MMEIHVATQGLIFASMFACGICFGLLFDFFRAVRKVISMNSFWVNLTDLLFWVLCTAIVFFSARVTNQGELRWYEFIGLFLGIGLYFLIFGSLMAKWMAGLLRCFIQLIVLILKIVLFPVRLACKPFGFLLHKTAPWRKKVGFACSIWRQKWLFSHHQMKKIFKSPKFF
ncbi:MAG: hypothetical protein E7399_03765 [Ruminococcaceae bacterium]|nr:hypothetical protein [Oscillospiraceae bacterium]